MAGRVGGLRLPFVHARLVEHVPALELAAHLARLKVGQAHRARAVRRMRRWVEDHAAHLGNLLRAQASLRRPSTVRRHAAIPLDDAPAAAAEDAHQAEVHHGAADVQADEDDEHEREREAQPV